MRGYGVVGQAPAEGPKRENAQAKQFAVLVAVAGPESVRWDGMVFRVRSGLYLYHLKPKALADKKNLFFRRSTLRTRISSPKGVRSDR